MQRIQQRARFWSKKKLAGTSLYTVTTDVLAERTRLEEMGLMLQAGEEPCGVHLNPSGSRQDVVVITTCAVYCREQGQWTGMEYEKLREFEVQGAKEKLDCATLRQVDGREMRVQMLNDEPAKPLCSLHSFLKKVAAVRFLSRNRPKYSSGELDWRRQHGLPMPEDMDAIVDD
jgi:hypothetical protein